MQTTHLSHPHMNTNTTSATSQEHHENPKEEEEDGGKSFLSSLSRLYLHFFLLPLNETENVLKELKVFDKVPETRSQL